MKSHVNPREKTGLKKLKRENAPATKSRSKSSLSINHLGIEPMKNRVNEVSVKFKGDFKVAQAPKISSSIVAFQVLLEAWNKDQIELQESFKIILLNNANRVKGIYEVSSGGITGTLVDLRIIFAVLLKSLSTAVILAHNHPSGNLKPSYADKQLTEKIKKAGELLDIKILDHIILSPDGNYFSFSDEGLI